MLPLYTTVGLTSLCAGSYVSCKRVSNNICCCAACCGAVPLRRRPCCNPSICPTCRDTAANLLHAAGQIDRRTDRQINGRTPYCYIDPASNTMPAVRKMHKLELPYRICTVTVVTNKKSVNCLKFWLCVFAITAGAVCVLSRCSSVLWRSQSLRHLLTNCLAPRGWLLTSVPIYTQI